MDRRAGRLTIAPVLCAFCLTVAPAPPGAAAAIGEKQTLVSQYAPILMLRAQEDPPCDTTEEQFQPTTVDVVLGNPRVKLVLNAGRKREEITTAPTAADIAGLGSDYYMVLPGDPLDAGCTYAKDFAALKRAGRAPPVTYARIATERGHRGFVVQYWFFYYFNQFNDVHEGDWEGMQIAFDARTPAAALRKGPYEIALFQHGGGEKADWDDGKVEKEGDHPVVYPAAGSHATFYDSAVFVENGQGGSGVGCDNTTEPLRRLSLEPQIIPTEPTLKSSFQWLTYEGHWGQKEKGFNTGPTGPNTKAVWSEPFTWMDGVRRTSPTLPGGAVLGPAATGIFCSGVAAASEFINLQARSTLGVLLLALIAVLLIAVPAVVTRWRPVDLSTLRQPRAFGQLIRGARQLYGRHWRAFLLLGLSAAPIIGAVEAAQWLYQQITGSHDLNPSLSVGGLKLELSLSIAGVGRTLGFTIAAAAVISFVCLLERGEAASFLAAYREALGRFWRLVLGQLLAIAMVIGLLITVIGIPIAVWKFIGWQFVQQEILFRDKSIRQAFHGSSDVVRGNWWRTLRTAGFLWLVGAAAGPVLGFVLIFANFSLVWVNLISSFVFAVLIPYVAIGRTLLYLDLRAREELQPAPRRRRRLRAGATRRGVATG